MKEKKRLSVSKQASGSSKNSERDPPGVSRAHGLTAQRTNLRQRLPAWIQSIALPTEQPGEEWAKPP